jgi:hypothetical protein
MYATAWTLYLGLLIWLCFTDITLVVLLVLWVNLALSLPLFLLACIKLLRMAPAKPPNADPFQPNRFQVVPVNANTFELSEVGDINASLFQPIHAQVDNVHSNPFELHHEV